MNNKKGGGGRHQVIAVQKNSYRELYTCIEVTLEIG